MDLSIGNFEVPTTVQAFVDSIDHFTEDPGERRFVKAFTSAWFSCSQRFLSGQPVDLQPIAALLTDDELHAGGGGGDQDQSKKDLFKSVVDFVCRNLQAFINGEPLDLQPTRSLLYRLIDQASDLTDKDRTLLTACADVIHCIVNGETVDLQAMCSQLLDWIDTMNDVPYKENIKSFVEVTCARLQLAFNGDEVDLEPVCVSLYEWIDMLADTPADQDRDVMKHCANIFCALGECFFRRPSQPSNMFARKFTTC